MFSLFHDLVGVNYIWRTYLCVFLEGNLLFIFKVSPGQNFRSGGTWAPEELVKKQTPSFYGTKFCDQLL